VPGPLALVGSGEFLPQMRDTDTRLLDGRPRKVVLLPTAAAPEGPARVRYWTDLAVEHYAALGAETVPVLVRDRADAVRAQQADAFDGVGLVYLSGGDPHHLGEALRDTATWDLVVAAWRGGAALAGCSAGAMAIAAAWPPIRSLTWRDLRPGLGLVPGLAVIPHFDRVLRWRRGAVERVAGHAPDGVVLVGIDEDTALVFDDGAWRVEGRGEAWRIGPDGPTPVERDAPDLPPPAA
jgi:cyanophycinase